MTLKHKVQTSAEGRYNQKAGHVAEHEFGLLLKSLGYNAKYPENSNQKGFDIIAKKGNKGYIIEVKSDINGDDTVGSHTPEQRASLIKLSKQLNLTPVLVKYYPRYKTYMAYYVNANERTFRF
jgi:Holliday junction resolvase